MDETPEELIGSLWALAAMAMDPEVDRRIALKARQSGKTSWATEHAGEMDGDGIVSYPKDKPYP